LSLVELCDGRRAERDLRRGDRETTIVAKAVLHPLHDDGQHTLRAVAQRAVHAQRLLAVGVGAVLRQRAL